LKQFRRCTPLLERGAEPLAEQWTSNVAMKIVTANHADSLRRPGERDTAEVAILDSVREELLSFYGEGDAILPLELAMLAQRLDYAGSARVDRVS